MVVCFKCVGEEFNCLYEVGFKKFCFDVRNLLILVVDVLEEDLIFDVDVIGKFGL